MSRLLQKTRPILCQLLLTAASLPLLLLLSCQQHRASALAADYYYVSSYKDLSSISRVALIELVNQSSYPQISEEITTSLFQALQKRQVFGLTTVSRDDPVWSEMQVDLNSTYTLEEMSAIRHTLKCDAILIGTLTEYEPYPHITVGLRLELIDLADGRLLWALEQVWDGADSTTEHRIERYLSNQMRSGSATLRQQLVTVSPLRFVRFVAYEVGETL